MMARQTGQEAQLMAFYNMGRNDAGKLNFPHWIGAKNTPEEEAYNKGFEERKKEIVDNEQ